jgi:hypothetical protein
MKLLLKNTAYFCALALTFWAYLWTLELLGI